MSSGKLPSPRRKKRREIWSRDGSSGSGRANTSERGEGSVGRQCQIDDESSGANRRAAAVRARASPSGVKQTDLAAFSGALIRPNTRGPVLLRRRQKQHGQDGIIDFRGIEIHASSPGVGEQGARRVQAIQSVHEHALIETVHENGSTPQRRSVHAAALPATPGTVPPKLARRSMLCLTVY